MFIILSKEIAKNLHHSFSLYREPLFVHSFFFHIHVQYLNRRGIKKLQEKKTQKKKIQSKVRRVSYVDVEEKCTKITIFIRIIHGNQTKLP